MNEPVATYVSEGKDRQILAYNDLSKIRKEAHVWKYCGRVVEVVVPEKELPFEEGKTYKTHSGTEVRILTTKYRSTRGADIILGITSCNNCSSLHWYSQDGKIYAGPWQSPWDLLKDKIPEQRVYQFVNAE